MKPQGFSASELVVSIGLFAVVILILSSLWLTAQGGLSEIYSSNTLSENLQEFRTNLSVEKFCSLNFVGVPLTMSNPDGVAVPVIRTFDTNGVPHGVLFETGKKIGGVTHQKLTLKPNTQVGLSHIAADLEIEYKKNVISGEIPVIRHLSLLAQVQAGLVQKCWLRRDSATLASAATCMALSGGALNEYNPVTEACGMTNGQWFLGTDPNSATCPAGSTLPVDAIEWANCGFDEPAGFVDPTPTGDQSAPYYNTINKPSRTCSCAYDVLIPAPVIATFQCKIYCVVL